MKKPAVIGVFCFVLLPSVCLSGAVQLSGLPGTVRVRRQEPFSGWDSIAIGCARGETESCQIVITASGGHLRDVRYEISPFETEKGEIFPPGDIEIFREIYIPLRRSSPHAVEPPGFIPDALVPQRNPYTGEEIEAARFEKGKVVGYLHAAVGFEIWKGHHQPLWLDFHADRETAPGLYRGSVKVWARGVSPASIEITVQVWDFTLPPGPTHENHFGGLGGVMARHKRSGGDPDRLPILLDRAAELMAQHRLNPPVPTRLYPKPAEDGTVVFTEEQKEDFLDFVRRHHVTNFLIPHAPYSDPLVSSRLKAIAFYRSWYACLSEMGLAERSYVYVLDEPNDATAYQRVRDRSALLEEADPRIRRLVVEQPYPQDPEWGTLDESVDIWCPLFGFIHEPSIERVRSRGDVVWSYTALTQTAPEYHPDYEKVRDWKPPFWQLDFPLTSYRVATWLNRRYGITGLLYWSTVHWMNPLRNPWEHPEFRLRWNGEGALFYPGDEVGIEGLVTSMRLKNLRDGMEDYEYFILLEKYGGKETVERFVREIVPTWGTWDDDPYRVLDLRNRMAEEILQRKRR